jgi:hypothetical protein
LVASAGKGVFVTCWHCVAEELPPNRFYGVLVRGRGGYTARALTLVEREPAGRDLATARMAPPFPPLSSTFATVSAREFDKGRRAAHEGPSGHRGAR